jgi:hypothetical protein
LNHSSRSDAIAAESREFLICLFTDLRDDLADQADAGGPSAPDPESVARLATIFDPLLAWLSGGSTLSDSDQVREYVVELAKATDEESEYERVEREHRALTELADALGSSTRSTGTHQAVRRQPQASPSEP